MPFASFKNVQKRYARTHKERAQPEHRKHLGFLPKKKDFVLRAREKEKKEKKMKELRRQALTRNADEFYFNMCNSVFDNERGHIPLNAEVQHTDVSMKNALSMSIAQLRHELQKEVAKIRRLESSTCLLHGEHELRPGHAPPRHTFFAESRSEAAEIRSAIRDGAFVQPFDGDAEVQNERHAVYKELEERLTRAEQLKLLLRQREAKQSLTNNRGHKYRVVTKGTKTSAPVYQFETVRSH
ncbi:U3 small nucleolar RNA-associated protein 11 [Fasciola gigantica]|uniref:U3 small nucleolar RNA-associated protein 11 n=1 Tax=Fasciola gigantica TaxID=46835 RepID=A0A504Z1N7_FASGI|nr:U3 small nucleolar RNA-associated protein 11 [Fasciola gigantica]